MKDQFHPVIPAKAEIYDQHKHSTPYPQDSQVASALPPEHLILLIVG
ncbi:MAG: hypothetical protein OXF25_06675 [Cyanobacteria bacterium MAG CAR3_bin_5]|nr:hypothetical protein [Cyanobacteria bacterium MAG CAR3_bin_5]